MPSWEYFQQPTTATLPLWWVAGLCNDGRSGGFDVLMLLPNTIYAVPFDQMRDATVSQLMINLLSQDSNPGAQVRLGIYQNNSSTDNVPNTLVLDAGTLTIDDTVNTGIQAISSLSQSLTTDIRYWLALFRSANVSNARIAALDAGATIPWGVFQNPSPGSGYGFSIARQIVLPNQVFGSMPSPFPTGDLSIDNLATTYPVPAIAMAFSSVT